MVRTRTGKAFTLIELLVVIGIIGLLFGLSVPALIAMKRGQRLKSTGRIVQSALLLAKRMTINRKVHHRIVFFKDRVLLWREGSGFIDEHGEPLRPEHFDDNTDLASTEYGYCFGFGISYSLKYKHKKDQTKMEPPEFTVKSWKKLEQDHRRLDNWSLGFRYDGSMDFFGFISVPLTELGDEDKNELPENADIIFSQFRESEKCFVDIDPSGGRVHYRVARPAR